jgi:hypothetical protein
MYLASAIFGNIDSKTFVFEQLAGTEASAFVDNIRELPQEIKSRHNRVDRHRVVRLFLVRSMSFINLQPSLDNYWTDCIGFVYSFPA